MPTYEITSPDGKKYRVTGKGSKEEALAAVKRHSHGQENGTLRPADAGIAGKVGNWLYDKANAIGLPASRMRQDLGKVDQFVRGAADTVTFGAADEIAAGATALTANVPYETALERERLIDEQGGGARTAGQVAGGLMFGKTMVNLGLSPAARAVQAGKGVIPTALTSAIEGAGYGAGYGFGSGEGIDDRVEKAKTGGGTGFAVGAAVPLVATGGTKLAQKFVSPNKIAPHRQAMVDTLNREGVRTTAGQKTGNYNLRYAESELGGRKAGQIVDEQKEQFTSAILKRIGVNANRATPDVIDQAHVQIGGIFDDLTARNTLRVDRQLITDLRAVVDDYQVNTSQMEQIPLIRNKVQDIVKDLMGGSMDGRKYQSIRSELGKMARKQQNYAAKEALLGVQSSMDDAMERTLAATNPSDIPMWKDARNKWRNLIVVEDAATRGGGEDTAMGLISPAKLQQAAKLNQGKSGYARGQGDFSELARAGNALMTPLPQSGTSPRLMANLVGTAARGGSGALIGNMVGGPVGGAIGGGIGAMAPAIKGAAIMSRPGQAFLSNQAFTKLSPQRQAVIEAMMRNALVPQAVEATPKQRMVLDALMHQGGMP